MPDLRGLCIVTGLVEGNACKAVGAKLELHMHIAIRCHIKLSAQQTLDTSEDPVE